MNFEPIITEIIERTPDWHFRKISEIERLNGLTNATFRFRVDEEFYVLRVGGEHASYLGIDRSSELEILRLVERAGIGPEVFWACPDEGHLITKWIEGSHWTHEEYMQTSNLDLAISMMTRLHELETSIRFDPFERIKLLHKSVDTLNVDLPDDFDSSLEIIEEIRGDQLSDPERRQVLCHNDLVAANIMALDHNNSIRFIDFEFAGLNDPYFDLASFIYAQEYMVPLSDDLEIYILKSYFGKVDGHIKRRLSGMQVLLLVFYSLWGFVLHGCEKQGLVESPSDFDYLEYARDIVLRRIPQVLHRYSKWRE